MCKMNLPSDYIDELKTIFETEEDYQNYLRAMETSPVKGLRINPILCDEEREAKIVDLFSLTKTSWEPHGYYQNREAAPAPGRHPLHEAGAYYIQEPSAMIPVTQLDIHENMCVLDLCAAPGGKTTQIASYMKNTGILITNEPVPKRAKILAENVERMGIRNAIVTCEKPEKLSARFPEYFDRILCDAPCSGEGMFRKDPDAINEWSKENVLMCAERQRDILREAVKMLAPGGRLVYSTCTFSKEEDEENVEFVLKEFPELKLISQEKYFPHKIEGEGHFAAVFERSGDHGNHGDGSCDTATGISIKMNSVSQEPSPQLSAFIKDFFANESLPIERVIIRNSRAYLLPPSCPGLSGLATYRTGLHLGEIKKDRFEPDHALAKALLPKDVKRSAELPSDSPEVRAYLRGEVIRTDKIDIPSDGWTLVTTDGVPLGLAKAVKGTLKNHYPKGLRKNL